MWWRWQVSSGRHTCNKSEGLIQEAAFHFVSVFCSCAELSLKTIVTEWWRGSVWFERLACFHFVNFGEWSWQHVAEAVFSLGGWCALSSSFPSQWRFVMGVTLKAWWRKRVWFKRQKRAVSSDRCVHGIYFCCIIPENIKNCHEVQYMMHVHAASYRCAMRHNNTTGHRQMQAAPQGKRVQDNSSTSESVYNHLASVGDEKMSSGVCSELRLVHCSLTWLTGEKISTCKRKSECGRC